MIAESVNCCRCFRQVEAERLAVIQDTRICAHCAKVLNPPRVMGSMHFAHKTAPTIQIMSAEFYKTNWKKYNPSFGRGSGVHKMSPSRS